MTQGRTGRTDAVAFLNRASEVRVLPGALRRTAARASPRGHRRRPWAAALRPPAVPVAAMTREVLCQVCLTDGAAAGHHPAVVTTDRPAPRSARHAALGEPSRPDIVDELLRADRSPVELRRRLELESNLLAHHLDVLEEVGHRTVPIERRRPPPLRAPVVGALDDLTRRPSVGPALRCSCAAPTPRDRSSPLRSGPT